MRLHIGVLGMKELLGAVTRQVLYNIGEFTAAVITLPGITFGVFVGEDTTSGLENSLRREILTRDQFETSVLAVDFMLNGAEDFGIHFGKRAGHPILFGHQF